MGYFLYKSRSNHKHLFHGLPDSEWDRLNVFILSGKLKNSLLGKFMQMTESPILKMELYQSWIKLGLDI